MQFAELRAGVTYYEKRRIYIRAAACGDRERVKTSCGPPLGEGCSPRDSAVAELYGCNLNITLINSIKDLLLISFSNSSSVKSESPTRATNSTKKRR